MEYKGRVEYRVAVEYKGRVAESLLLPKPGLTGSGCLFVSTYAGSVYSMALYLMHGDDDVIGKESQIIFYTLLTLAHALL